MSSYLDIEGMYDKTKRYIVNNWSEEDFSQEFGAESVYNGDKVITAQPAYILTIKAGEMRELGQFEAYIFTKHFVDREMTRKAEGLSQKEIERIEMGINNAELRKPFEDKTIQEIKAGASTSFMDKIREDIRKEEIAKLNKEEVTPKEEELFDPLTQVEEFEGVK